MQSSASGVLEEVKKKKMDIQRLLGVADALKELRTIRRETSRKEGVSSYHGHSDSQRLQGCKFPSPNFVHDL